ncbi:MAG: hypothetical protein PHI13_03200 [Methylococcales bacterium]|nr:hypothetical protein [Methylococcales bacterium]
MSSSATAVIEVSAIVLLNIPKRLAIIHNARQVIAINKTGKIGSVHDSFHPFIMNGIQAFVRLIFRSQYSTPSDSFIIGGSLP